MSEQGGGGGAILWVFGMLIGGYLDWRSRQQPTRDAAHAARADERLAAQAQATLEAIEEEREHQAQARRARAAALHDELTRRSRSRRGRIEG